METKLNEILKLKMKLQLSIWKTKLNEVLNYSASQFWEKNLLVMAF